MEAASGGYADIVKLLISHGANVNAKSRYINDNFTYVKYHKSVANFVCEVLLCDWPTVFGIKKKFLITSKCIFV